MSDIDETKSEDGAGDKKPLSLKRPGRLELRKTVDAGQVRQSFSHGRSKAVTVEVKRKRTFKPGQGDAMTEVKAAARVTAEAAIPAPAATPVPAPAAATRGKSMASTPTPRRGTHSGCLSPHQARPA